MNCADIEEKIFMRDLLSKEEKAEVDQHLAQCAGCREKAALYALQMQTVASIPQPEIKNAANLTSRIMERIAIHREPVWYEVMIQNFQTNWARVSLAMISVVLIVFFITEQQSGDQLTRNRPSQIVNGPVLDLNKFIPHGNGPAEKKIKFQERLSQLKKSKSNELL
jgi:anti-sigma factor RsiW